MAEFHDEANLSPGEKGRGFTCQDEVDLVHHQVGVLLREAHGRLELQDVAVRTVGAQQDLLLLQPGAKVYVVFLS